MNMEVSITQNQFWGKIIWLELLPYQWYTKGIKMNEFCVPDMPNPKCERLMYVKEYSALEYLS